MRKKILVMTAKTHIRGTLEHIIDVYLNHKKLWLWWLLIRIGGPIIISGLFAIVFVFFFQYTSISDINEIARNLFTTFIALFGLLAVFYVYKMESQTRRSKTGIDTLHKFISEFANDDKKDREWRIYHRSTESPRDLLDSFSKVEMKKRKGQGLCYENGGVLSSLGFDHLQ